MRSGPDKLLGAAGLGGLQVSQMREWHACRLQQSSGRRVQTSFAVMWFVWKWKLPEKGFRAAFNLAARPVLRRAFRLVRRDGIRCAERWLGFSCWLGQALPKRKKAG
jgi:hypothetical protein